MRPHFVSREFNGQREAFVRLVVEAAAGAR
jgi:hypothetical protein